MVFTIYEKKNGLIFTMQISLLHHLVSFVAVVVFQYLCTYSSKDFVLIIFALNHKVVFILQCCICIFEPIVHYCGKELSPSFISYSNRIEANQLSFILFRTP